VITGQERGGRGMHTELHVARRALFGCSMGRLELWLAILKEYPSFARFMSSLEESGPLVSEFLISETCTQVGASTTSKEHDGQTIVL
jgi:hypothetical protein